MNKLFEDNVVTFDGKKIEIKDFDAFYIVQKQLADEILELYRGPDANEESAKTWIKQKCRANSEVKKLKEFLDPQDEE